MSLLLDALDRAERARREQRSLAHPDLSLEPREGGAEARPADESAGHGDGSALFQLESTRRRALPHWLRRSVPWLALLVLLALAGGGLWSQLQLPSNTVESAPAPPVLAPAAASAPPVGAPSAGTAPPGGVAAARAHPAAGNATAMAAPLAVTPAAGAAPAATPIPRPGTPAHRLPPRRLPQPAPAIAPEATGVPGQPTAPPAAQVRNAPGVDVRLFRSTPAPALDPALTEAWNALRAGRLDAASTAYRQLAREQPGNVDVQLGLGRISAEQGQGDEARRHFQRALELDPRNATALAGLAVLEPVNSNRELDGQLRMQGAAREPDAQFGLASRLSAAAQWPEAEQAWFEALRGHPGEPDLLFNLAVALDHLGQAAAARQYYREALDAAQAHPAHFSRPQLEQRLQALGGN
ncbi:MAG: tetratricopeptide repeat protein [Pseudomonadota bacterium]|nr:tetratricopeptide repeat protein [Pseudomonadota bacterium]